MSAATGAAGQLTLGQCADHAEQAIRVLNHRIRPAVGQLTDPVQAAEVIAALASLAGMLPQLLDQLTCWLLDQQHAGRLRVDSFAPLPEVAGSVHATAGALARAIECIRRAGHALEGAHQHAAHLAGTDDSNDEWGKR